MKYTCELCEYYNKLKHGGLYCDYWYAMLYDSDKEICEEFREDADTIQTCKFCSYAFVYPEIPEGMIFCTRMDTKKPCGSWCENWEKYESEVKP